jgi:hypothetical protein
MIPPRLVDYYSILKVPKAATPEDIKDAYRQRAKELHPDKNKANDATARFQQLQEAYSVLGSPERRDLYDRGDVAAAVDPATKATEVVFEPVPCGACACISAQPRFVQYDMVLSFIFFSYRIRPAGVFCPSCASKRLFLNSLLTGSIGWLGVRGFFWSLEAMFRNASGGTMAPGLNAYILAKQAGYFMQQGRPDLASALASESSEYFRKCRFGSEDYSLGKLGDDYATSLLGHPQCKRVRVRNRWTGWSVPARYAAVGLAIPLTVWVVLFASSASSAAPQRSYGGYMPAAQASTYQAAQAAPEPAYVNVPGPNGITYRLLETDYQSLKPQYDEISAEQASLAARQNSLTTRRAAIEQARAGLTSATQTEIDDFNQTVNSWNADIQQLKSDSALNDQKVSAYNQSLSALDKPVR